MSDQNNSTPQKQNENFYVSSIPQLEDPKSIRDFLSTSLDKFSNMNNLVDIKFLENFFIDLIGKVDDEMIDYGASLISFMIRLFRANCGLDFFILMLDQVREMIGLSALLRECATIYRFLKEQIVAFYNRMCVHIGITYSNSEKTTVHSESAIADLLSDVRKNLGNILHSEVVTSIRDLVLSLVGLKVFGLEDATRITSVLGPAKPCDAFSLIDLTLGAAISFFRAGDNYTQGGGIMSIFGSDDPVGAFIEEAKSLKQLENITYTGIPVDGKLCIREYSSHVQACLKSAEEINENLPRKAVNRLQFDKHFLSLKMVRNNLLNKMTGHTRPAPYAVCIEGMPGIGKSMLLDMVGKVYSKVKDRTYDSSHMYNRQATEEYWSGYDPLSQPIIHYSEPGSLHQDIAKKSGDPVMTEFLSVCDNAPYMCNMADVESKGKVYAIPELIVMDCNDAEMNLKYIVNNPAAVKRRILYIRPTVKKEFLKGSSCKIDTLKSLNSDKPILDRWNFTVYRHEPVSNTQSDILYMLQDASVYDTCQYLQKDMIEHIQSQEQRVSVSEKVNISDYLGVSESITIPKQVREVIYHHEVEEPLEGVTEEITEIDNSISFRENLCNVFSSLNSMFGSLMFYWFLTMCCYLVENCTYVPVRSALAYGLRSKANKSWERSANSYQLTRCHLNLSNSYSAARQISESYAPYVLLFTGMVSAYQMYRSCTTLIETEALFTNRKGQSLEESMAEVRETEKRCGCDLPPPRAKRGNAINWEVPRPVPLSASNQLQLHPLEQTYNAIARNVRSVTITGDDFSSNTRVCGICQDYALINCHAIPSSATGLLHFRTTLKDADMNVRNISIVDKEIYQVNSDIYLVRLRGELFRDIRPYLTTSEVEYENFEEIGSNGWFDDVPLLVRKAAPFVIGDEHYGDFKAERPFKYSHSVHAKGMCGEPLVALCGRAVKLVGLHIAGSNTSDVCYSEYIDGSCVLTAIRLLEENSVLLNVQSEGKLRLPEDHQTITQEINSRSPLNFEEVYGLSIFGDIGSLPFPQKGKSNVCSSKFTRCAEELTGVSCFKDGLPLFAPPPMGAINADGEYAAPFNNFTKKAGVVKKSLDPRIMDKTVKYLVKYLHTKLKERGVDKLTPTTLEVAQNGFVEDFYMRPMKASTSGGWAYPGPKSKYSEKCSVSFKDEAYMPHADVVHQVNEQIAAYSSGAQANVILGTQLKDEPRAYEKVKAAKTRVFSMSPYDSTLVNRMFLMPFYSLMVEHGDIFGTSIGINMHSTDVDVFVKTMTEFSDKMMEGDYGDFDTSMPYDVGLMSNSVTHELLRLFGYSEPALQVIKGILSENLNPVLIMGRTLFRAPSLQPSGKYGTAEENSLRGLIMLVYAWFHLECDEKLGDFFKHVLPRIYGDDLLSAIKPKAQKFFNNLTYQTVCRDVYGIRYTSAQKTQELKPLLDFNETSFLRRTFVYNKHLGHWVALLERKSIMKTICYYLPSKLESVEGQMLSSCISALRELFFWTPPQEYDDLRVKFATRYASFYNREFDDVIKCFKRYDEIANSIYGVEEEVEIITSEAHWIPLQKMTPREKENFDYVKGKCSRLFFEIMSVVIVTQLVNLILLPLNVSYEFRAVFIAPFIEEHFVTLESKILFGIVESIINGYCTIHIHYILALIQFRWCNRNTSIFFHFLWNLSVFCTINFALPMPQLLLYSATVGIIVGTTFYDLLELM